MATSEEKSTNTKEGNNLLGSPTFKELENGRFQCVETGHQLLAKDIESYSQSKRCRLGLIEFALTHKKPPLNMFKQDPLSRLKLVCKLTGDTINKTEEHIWKHINGKRFLNRLEELVEGKLNLNEMDKGIDDQKPEKASKPGKDGARKEKKEKKKKKKKEVMEEDDGDNEIISETPKSHSEESDSEEFWIPPPGSRWDFDDGGDRWGSDSESESNDENKSDEVDRIVEDGDEESEEISMWTKRMSIEIGPSSFASRKKKVKRTLHEWTTFTSTYRASDREVCSIKYDHFCISRIILLLCSSFTIWVGGVGYVIGAYHVLMYCMYHPCKGTWLNRKKKMFDAPWT